MQLTQTMAPLNNMTVVTKGPLNINSRTRAPRERVIQAVWVADLEPGTIYIEHCNWLDFRRYELPEPIYINLVRDPVERMISWFYYVRSGYRNAIVHRRFPNTTMKSEKWFKKSYNECVRSGDPECQYVPGSVKDTDGNYKRQSLFYCGHNRECLPFDSPHAIQLAKRNVERDYAVVGSWEDTNITLAVLEAYIPRFFRGARHVFDLHSNSIRNRNRNNRKPRVDPDVREMMSSLNVRDLNNTRKAQMELVFFNRVPKVGSQTFMELLRRLSERNNFQFHRDAVQKVETIRLAEDQQQEMAEVISELPEPSVFIKHVCFTNFTKFNLPKPIYLNVVRDPVERVISWFYYVRAPWYFVERKAAFPDLPLPHPAWLKKDFETCVTSGDQECTYTQGVTVEGIGDHRRQSLFFCGHDYECTPFNTVGALEKAKFAVEQQYAVVGVLEDLNTTLSVLEKYVPRFFEGVRDIYATSAEYLTKINKNNFKPPVSESVKDIVRRNFTNEIEFYQFCRQRLHKQYLAAHLPQRIITDSAHPPGIVGN
ncbi:blast:Heparan sulfate 2-O-sulfotransferase pipe [Drosophila guanche]|uniref:Blast:Heparan sulfate 2-O-sulfotransferase pipe n=1 Tax=Drosophila guanche TaxID=7266 RepID=A0A3B0JT91_DROGU|nr:blast:Heparan sulfate 2-O-sulfotransferase pipe [Drosophila guanche]